MKKQISVIARTVAFQQTCHPTCMFRKLCPLLYSTQAWARRGVTPVPSAPRLVSPQEGQLCPMCPSGAQPGGLCVPPPSVPTSRPEAVLQVQPAGRFETHRQLRRGHSSQEGGVGCEAQGCHCPSCSAQSESGVLLWDKSVLTLSSSAREQRSCPGGKAGSMLCQET